MVQQIDGMREDYVHFDADDFLQDSSFLAWMKGHDPAINLFWEQWQKDHPEKSGALSEARERYKLLISFKPIVPSSSEQEEVWRNIESHTEAASRPDEQKTGYRKLLYWSCAAAFILLLTAGWIGYKKWTGHPEEKWVVVQSANEKKEITLPDSSVIVLNAHATLKHHPGNPREWWISGEAFFDVRHKWSAENARKPFIVHAGVEDIAVLGTAFSVNAYPEGVRVVLLQGKVKASVNDHAVVLQPGEKVEWSHNHFSKALVNAQLYMAWKDGEFRFDHTSVEELAELLKDVYGYELVIKNSPALHTKNISGNISADNEETLWKALALLFDAKVEKKGEKIFLIAN